MDSISLKPPLLLLLLLGNAMVISHENLLRETFTRARIKSRFMFESILEFQSRNLCVLKSQNCLEATGGKKGAMLLINEICLRRKVLGSESRFSSTFFLKKFPSTMIWSRKSLILETEQ